LDDWLEGIAVFSPSIRDSEAVGVVALRQLAVTCPPIPNDDTLRADELEEVGLAAEQFDLHPDEAARIVADQQFVRAVRAAHSYEARFEAIKAGVLRLKDAEIEALRATKTASQSAAEQAERKANLAELKRRRLEASRTRLDRAKTAIEPDAEFGRAQRRRGPVAIGAAVLFAAFVAFGLPEIPGYARGSLLQRGFAICCAILLAFCAALWIGGYRKRAWTIIAAVSATIGFAVSIHEGYASLGDVATRATAQSSADTVPDLHEGRRGDPAIAPKPHTLPPARKDPAPASH